jgi:hypothetical protein
VLVGGIVLAVVDGPDPSVATFSNSHTTTTLASLEPKAVSGTQTALTIPIVPANSTVSVSPEISVDPAQSSTDSDSTIPFGLYLLATALLGGLLGVLIPLPWRSSLPAKATSSAHSASSPKPPPCAYCEAFVVVVVVALLVYAGLRLDWDVTKNKVPIEIVAAAGGAALIGLFVPSPAKRW